MIRWTGLAPWEFELPFPGSLTSTFLDLRGTLCVGKTIRWFDVGEKEFGMEREFFRRKPETQNPGPSAENARGAGGAAHMRLRTRRGGIAQVPLLSEEGTTWKF